MNNENDEMCGSNSRRDFLKKVGGAGLAGLAAPLLPGIAKAGQPEPAGSINVIKHVVFQIQENHSYDNYFGKYAKNPSGIGFPASYECSGIKPFHETSVSNSYDPSHYWSNIHTGWANGAMNGWVAANSRSAMGFYHKKDLPYYYSLLPEFTLCGMYFCSMLTDTQPNRLCTFAATSGGDCNNEVQNDYFPSTFPIIFDLLKEAGITFKNYNLNESANYSYAACWKNWATGGPNNELNATYTDFENDCKNDTLPQVVYLTNNLQEHPGDGAITGGMNQMKSFIGTIMASKAWASTAIFLTYDEGGAFFDHVEPPQIKGEDPANGFGSLGVRVPCFVISPYALKDNVDTTASEHASVLKFIEKLFGLPTLASVNKLFNSSTPTASVLQNATGGAPFPPRDGQPNSVISDMTQCFNFNQAPNLYPDVPGTPWYSKQTERGTTVAYSFGR
jgi:phospholipase C